MNATPTQPLDYLENKHNGNSPPVPPSTEGPRTPSGDDLSQALAMFVLLLGHIISVRAKEFNLARWGDIGVHASNLFAKQINVEAPTMPTDTVELVSIAVLFEELQFFVWRYQQAAPDNSPVATFAKTLNELWGIGNGVSILSKDAVSDAENVYDSISKFLSWLPKPLRWLLEAIMEALKLAHGNV